MVVLLPSVENNSKVKLCYFLNHFEESPSWFLSTYIHTTVAHLASNKTSFTFQASLKMQLLASSLRFLVAVYYFFSFFMITFKNKLQLAKLTNEQL